MLLLVDAFSRALRCHLRLFVTDERFSGLIQDVATVQFSGALMVINEMTMHPLFNMDITFALLC